MNPLLENAHLFVGNFSIEWPADDLVTEIYGFEKHVGPDNSDCFILADGDYLPVEKCKLIARPISDMTDEECRKAFFSIYPDSMEWLFEEYEEAGEIHEFVEVNLHKTALFLYVKSIGVYPFDQSHFDDGTVLKASEVQP